MSSFNKSLKKNGYNPSIMPTREGRCYVCNKETDTAIHEIFYGTANRKNSKKYGTWVYVCPSCHDNIHDNPNRGTDIHLKRNAQWCFEQYNTRQEFIRIFGRTWL